MVVIAMNDISFIDEFGISVCGFNDGYDDGF